MLKFFSGTLLIGAAFMIAYSQFPVGYYLTPKQERLYQIWKTDLDKLSNDPKFAKIFQNLSQVDVHFTDPQVATEFEEFRTPFSAAEGRAYILKISITRYIEKQEYGFVVQHELFDQNEDKIYEFGRTYKVGLIL
jgi:hypothetical protein